jgi:P27 family predicted phage terminase small subunit
MLAKDALPRCPPHLSPVARREWRRLATPLFAAGILTLADRAALAAYCQCYGRWVEAEEKLAETPTLLKTPSGYVQQSPWLGIANRQLELMGRYMAELGLTPAARARVAVPERPGDTPVIDRIELVSVIVDKDGNRVESPMGSWDDATAATARSRRIGCPAGDRTEAPSRTGKVTRIELDERL